MEENGEILIARTHSVEIIGVAVFVILCVVSVHFGSFSSYTDPLLCLPLLFQVIVVFLFSKLTLHSLSFLLSSLSFSMFLSADTMKSPSTIKW